MPAQNVENRRRAVASSEDELDLVANDAPAAVGETRVRLQEDIRGRAGRVGADEVRAARITRRRERADAALSEVRMVEDVVELGAKLDGFSLADVRLLHEVHVPEVRARSP